MTIKECPNCPGRDDHDAEHCPIKPAWQIDSEGVLRNANGEWVAELVAWDKEKLVVMLGGESQPQASAAQSAPAGEREAFEAAVAAVNERGWTTSTDLARQIWDSCAAWQRAQSAPAEAVPEGLTELLEMLVASDLRKIRYAGPWRKEVHNRAVAIRDALAAAPQQAPREWPVVHTSVGCIACEGSPAGDNNPCHICGATQPAAPVAECTNEDSWNCKYCRKTETCAALKDERNFGAPPKAARQEQGE